MVAWAGLERFLHLSMGSQVGSSSVALIAVLELKRILQYPEGCQGQSETSGCTVRLTAEEWRTVAGIHERKTFERAKAKLVELKVLHIDRNGRLLEITLWPEPLASSEVCISEVVPGLVQCPTENCSASYETSSGPCNETRLGTCSGTELGTRRGTSLETCFGTTSETETVSLSERVLLTREDKVFPSKNVPVNVISVRDNKLLRYPLNRYPFNTNTNTNTNTNINININNVSNGTTNHDQRNNVKRAAPPSEGVDLLEFAILWVQEVGHALTPYEKEGLVRFLRLGYTEELFVEALRCAVAADNHQMGYVLGILRNWYQEGVRCLQDVTESKKRWEDLRFVKRAKIF